VLRVGKREQLLHFVRLEVPRRDGGEWLCSRGRDVVRNAAEERETRTTDTGKQRYDRGGVRAESSDRDVRGRRRKPFGAEGENRKGASIGRVEGPPQDDPVHGLCRTVDSRCHEILRPGGNVSEHERRARQRN